TSYSASVSLLRILSTFMLQFAKQVGKQYEGVGGCLAFSGRAGRLGATSRTIGIGFCCAAQAVSRHTSRGNSSFKIVDFCLCIFACLIKFSLPFCLAFALLAFGGKASLHLLIAHGVPLDLPLIISTIITLVVHGPQRPYSSDCDHSGYNEVGI